MNTLTTLLDWIAFAARTAVGIFLISVFCVVVGTSVAWALVMGKPSPLGREEDESHV